MLATGKVAVDLIKQRGETTNSEAAIVRLEQLYPLPHAQLASVLETYPKGTPVIWVQEEPQNMGAWNFIKVNFGNSFYDHWPLAGKVTRPESASPSTGSKKTHQIEQEELLANALRSSQIQVRV